VDNVDERIAELTAGLGAPDGLKASLIAEQRAAFLSSKYDPELGRMVFSRSTCASCHRVGSVGSTIGPALDGIGNRGLDRLLEDTLDPNRNVDPAFRAVTILTDEGRVFSGFGVREEGKQVVFHDEKGAEVRLPLSQIHERMPSALSPMPSNIADQMPKDDYFALLAYLLSLK
jgi:putative heme-binding domain-containing protein